MTLINKIKEEERELKAKIRNEQCNLLAKVTENPMKWNSQSLQFTACQISTAPYLKIEFSKQMSEFKYLGTMTPVGYDEKIIGKIVCYENFNLSFECYFDTDGCIAIGEWFELNFCPYPTPGNLYMYLKQSNGLFSNADNDVQFVSADSNTQSYATKKSLSNAFIGQWNKEISSNFDFDKRTIMSERPGI